MRLNEHDPEYGAFMLNLDDFECRQQRKFSRKLSHLRTDAVLFFAKLKLKAQAKALRLDDNDIQRELNSVKSRMQPRVRPRHSQAMPNDGRLTRLMEKIFFNINKPIGVEEYRDDYEQSEDFAALCRVMMEKLTKPMKRDEFYRLVGAFAFRLGENGIARSRAREIMYELLYEAAEATQAEDIEPQPTVPEPSAPERER